MKKTGVIFLDRDGVINEYPGHFKYVTSVSGFRLLPRVKEALKRLTASGIPVFVVSNQAGVDKGLYSQKTLDDITEYMLQQLGGASVFKGILYCTHAAGRNCACRKPKTGLLNDAVSVLEKNGYSLDAAKSFFVGDSIIDVETGKAAGLRTIMVFSGRETRNNSDKWTIKPDYTAADLYEAVDIILYK